MNRAKRACVNHPDNFCYVCGKFTTKEQRKYIAKRLKIAYHHYFGVKLGDQEKSWAPHICCSTCYSGLTQWLLGEKSSMPFHVPMVWREPKNHHSDCYFCMTKIAGFSRKNKSSIVYPDCESAIKPVPHDDANPVQFHQVVQRDPVKKVLTMVKMCVGMSSMKLNLILISPIF